MWTWSQNINWSLPSYGGDNLVLHGDKVFAVGGDYYNLKAVKLLPNGQVELDDETHSPVVNALTAYPNPMKDRLTIRTQSSIVKNASLDIYNTRGQKIRSILMKTSATEWDGKDSSGRSCSNGVYILKDLSSNTSKYITKIK